MAALACSDEHFGRMSNILSPNRGENMGDGWKPPAAAPGNDWVIVALGHPGEIGASSSIPCTSRATIPTAAAIRAAYVKGGTDSQIETQSLFWRELLPSQKLSMHAEHEFAEQIAKLGPVTHVRLNIFPDGGVGRLRLFGKVVK